MKDRLSEFNDPNGSVKTGFGNPKHTDALTQRQTVGQVDGRTDDSKAFVAFIAQLLFAASKFASDKMQRRCVIREWRGCEDPTQKGNNRQPQQQPQGRLWQWHPSLPDSSVHCCLFVCSFLTMSRYFSHNRRNGGSNNRNKNNGAYHDDDDDDDDCKIVYLDDSQSEKDGGSCTVSSPPLWNPNLPNAFESQSQSQSQSQHSSIIPMLSRAERMRRRAQWKRRQQQRPSAECNEDDDENFRTDRVIPSASPNDDGFSHLRLLLARTDDERMERTDEISNVPTGLLVSTPKKKSNGMEHDHLEGLHHLGTPTDGDTIVPSQCSTVRRQCQEILASCDTPVQTSPDSSSVTPPPPYSLQRRPPIDPKRISFPTTLEPSSDPIPATTEKATDSCPAPSLLPRKSRVLEEGGKQGNEQKEERQQEKKEEEGDAAIKEKEKEEQGIGEETNDGTDTDPSQEQQAPENVPVNAIEPSSGEPSPKRIDKGMPLLKNNDITAPETTTESPQRHREQQEEKQQQKVQTHASPSSNNPEIQNEQTEKDPEPTVDESSNSNNNDKTLQKNNQQNQQDERGDVDDSAFHFQNDNDDDDDDAFPTETEPFAPDDDAPPQRTDRTDAVQQQQQHDTHQQGQSGADVDTNTSRHKSRSDRRRQRTERKRKANQPALWGDDYSSSRQTRMLMSKVKKQRKKQRLGDTAPSSSSFKAKPTGPTQVTLAKQSIVGTR